MGKATINSHLGDGQYNITVNYDKSYIDNEISKSTDQISALNAVIAGLPDGELKERAKLRRASATKRKEYLENTAKVPEDYETNAWCTDLTEDLTGEIGTVEVPTSDGSIQINIQPGYESNAVYDSSRDGQIRPAAGDYDTSVFYNWAMRAAWQKWKPLFRYGTITAIDTDNDLCDVELDAAKSDYYDGLQDINQTTSLTSVPISYMSCNAGAFEVDDEVVIQFTDQDWANPVVIGFKSDPKACGWLREQYDVFIDCPFSSSANLANDRNNFYKQKRYVERLVSVATFGKWVNDDIVFSEIVTKQSGITGSPVPGITASKICVFYDQEIVMNRFFQEWQQAAVSLVNSWATKPDVYGKVLAANASKSGSFPSWIVTYTVTSLDLDLKQQTLVYYYYYYTTGLIQTHYRRGDGEFELKDIWPNWNL